jgi:hypothetical protein
MTHDGARADGNHSGNSQHQEDSDGTVDAWDMGNMLCNSGVPTGSDRERELLEALQLDFEQDPHGRGHLWISHMEIAEHDEGWDQDPYGGSSPHDEHTHWEARQDREDDGRAWPLPHLERLVDTMSVEDVREYFHGVAQAVQGKPEATSEDRADRNNLAAALRYGFGLNYPDQTAEQLAPGRFNALETKVDELAEKLDQLLARE